MTRDPQDARAGRSQQRRRAPQESTTRASMRQRKADEEAPKRGSSARSARSAQAAGSSSRRSSAASGARQTTSSLRSTRSAAASQTNNRRSSDRSSASERTRQSARGSADEKNSSSRVRSTARSSAANEGRTSARAKRSLSQQDQQTVRGRSRRAKQEQLVQESGIPVDVLKDPLRPQRSSGAQSKKDSFVQVFTGACAWLWAKSRVASILIVAVLVLGIASGVDALANMNRIYQGVSVGNIDLSGKTIDEATTLIAQEYEPRINDNDVVFCASEEVAQKAQQDTSKRDSLEEQISYEESLASRDRWTINAQHLGATFDPAAYAQRAYQVGRDDGGLFGRIKAQLSGWLIEPVCTFNATSLDDFRDEIIAALGTKMINFNIKMEGDQANVTDGHDGYEVSEDWLIDKLNEGLLGTEGESRFVIDMHDVPVQIDHDGAQDCATRINNSIGQGITFQYEGKDWYADRAQLAQWVITEVEEEGGRFVLKPLFDASRANQTIIKGFGFSYGGSDYSVTFTNDNGAIMVQTNATGTVPQVSSAIDKLNESFFTTAEKSSAPVVSVSSVQVPESMSFDDACDYGLVQKISSFTTQYASGAEARNNNIHVAADALNNSICKAGETWSFLALSGEATPEKGYQGAGAIIGGEYSDAIGGGICQVATTVFNAVYDAGYPIEKRYNHSLYIASYPEGRDAAIAYPDLDLVWRNNTESDVLVVMSYTNSSVTATLYGVDPGFEVTTTYGEWQEGEPFRTVIRQDSDYPLGTEFVESSGADGRSITIVRTVKDQNGNIIQEKEFSSNYKPKNKVVVQGSATDTTAE